MTDQSLGQFSFSKLKRHFEAALAAGYAIISCREYLKNKTSADDKRLIARVDIDVSVKKAEMLAKLFDELGVKASFFVRLHAQEYNPFSFENYRIMKLIHDAGHEIGLHSEVVDQAAIWNEEAADCLRRDIDLLNRMFDIRIDGVASHGGMTGLNNLDFWRNRSAREFGLRYEAYDKQPEFNLFHESFYISDSDWTTWKCYDRGVRIPGDMRTPSEHFADGHRLVYLLIHPETYYDRHPYE
jgi:peptidoglycan/xylan/chitin deacetylase (PgdA/CDA1 family)